MIAFVVARTSHTFVDRRPATVGCGTRVHTIADAFAISTDATRSSTCSFPSSTSITLIWTHPSLVEQKGCPGDSSGNEKLIGVLVAQYATLQSRDPGAKLHNGLKDQGMTGIAGNPHDFHAGRDV